MSYEVEENYDIEYTCDHCGARTWSPCFEEWLLAVPGTGNDYCTFCAHLFRVQCRRNMLPAALAMGLIAVALIGGAFLLMTGC